MFKLMIVDWFALRGLCCDFRFPKSHMFVARFFDKDRACTINASLDLMLVNLSWASNSLVVNHLVVHAQHNHVGVMAKVVH